MRIESKGGCRGTHRNEARIGVDNALAEQARMPVTMCSCDGALAAAVHFGGSKAASVE